MTFDNFTPRKGSISALKGYIEIEYFDLRQVAHIIETRVQMERDYWNAVIDNNKAKIMEMDKLIRHADARITNWKFNKKDG